MCWYRFRTGILKELRLCWRHLDVFSQHNSELWTLDTELNTYTFAHSFAYSFTHTHFRSTLTKLLSCVVPSSIVSHLHVSHYCYNGLCRFIPFTRANHFLAPYMVDQSAILAFQMLRIAKLSSALQSVNIIRSTLQKLDSRSWILCVVGLTE